MELTLVVFLRGFYKCLEKLARICLFRRLFRAWFEILVDLEYQRRQMIVGQGVKHDIPFSSQPMFY